MTSNAGLAAFGYDMNELANMSHSSIVLVLTTLLERRLEMLLEGRMVHLSKSDKADLFEGYGPLSSLSAKIVISHALGLITAKQRKTLDQIRKVRNVFAHADNILHFGHVDFQNHPKLKGNPLTVSIAEFRQAVVRIAEELKPGIETAMLVRAMQDHRSEASAGTEK